MSTLTSDRIRETATKLGLTHLTEVITELVDRAEARKESRGRSTPLHGTQPSGPPLVRICRQPARISWPRRLSRRRTQIWMRRDIWGRTEPCVDVILAASGALTSGSVAK